MPGIIFDDIQKAIALELGWTATDANWNTDAVKVELISRFIAEGYRQFLYPPPVKATPGPRDPQGQDIVIRWSFLSPQTTVTVSGAATDLPAEFCGAMRAVALPAGSATSNPALNYISREQMASLKALSTATTGVPQYYTVAPKASFAGTAAPVWQLLLYPAPATSYALVCTYDIVPPDLSETYSYPIAPASYHECLLESCLAIAEERMNDGGQKLHRERFERLLLAAWQWDQEMAQADEAIETWPVADTAATTLDMSYTTLLKWVGHYLGEGWDYNVWTAEVRRRVDLIINDGIRDFLLPAIQQGEKYHWEWRFLRPMATMTLRAPYAHTGGAISIASGVVSAHDGEAFASWMAGCLLIADGTTYNISTYNIGGTLTLTDTSINVAASTNYHIYQVYYDMPSDFGALEGPFIYPAGSGLAYPQIEQTSIQIVRHKLAIDANEGAPSMMALVPKALDPTAATKYQAIFYPLADDDYELVYRYRVEIAPLTTTNCYPPGGKEHGNTILAACLARAELEADKKPGVWNAKYQERLAVSISFDRRMATPPYLGVNFDRSDRPLNPYWNWMYYDQQAVALYRADGVTPYTM